MGLYDLCVPLDEKRRPVILSIHKNHSSTVWQTMKNRLKLKRLSDPERSYKTSVRFLGERQDRTYYCVEGFVNYKDLCREVFIEKSIAVTFQISIRLLSGDTVTIDLDLVDLMENMHVIVSQRPRTSMATFATAFRDVNRSNCNFITARLLKEHYTDAQQIMAIANACKSAKQAILEDALQRTFHRKSIEQDKPSS
jgi:hypothetical protein